MTSAICGSVNRILVVGFIGFSLPQIKSADDRHKQLHQIG